jgi:hypothetical protein
LVNAQEEKVRIQQNNKNYWLMQMELRRKKQDEINKQPYDPELVWNIEGPTRRQTDFNRR